MSDEILNGFTSHGRSGNMFNQLSKFQGLMLACAFLFLSGCEKQKAPNVKILSEQEASDLWKRAESHAPVGELVVRKHRGDGGTIKTATQVYRLKMQAGKPGVSVAASCSGSCKLTPGGTFDDCKTSGCEPSGNSCTPLSCSGTCQLSNSCTPPIIIVFAP